MYKFFTMVIATLVLGGVMAFGFVTWTRTEKTETNVSIQEIRAIAQLTPVEFVMSLVLEQTKAREWYEWKNAKFLVMIEGKVKGSVDLDKAKISIDDEKKLADIHFPKEAIIIHNPEIGYTKAIEIANPNIFNRLNNDDFTKGQNQAIAELRKRALENGIREATKKRTKLVLSEFLRNFGYEANITFHQVNFKDLFPFLNQGP